MSILSRQPYRATGIGFLLAYAVPAIVVSSAWLARLTDYPNAFVFAPLAVAYALVPLVQTVWSRGLRPAAAGADAAAPSASHFRLPLWPSLPAQLAMLYVAGDLWSSGVLDAAGRAGLLLSTGIYSSIFAITIAHELIHRPGRGERFLGGLLLSTVAFGTFKIVHLRIHHRHVGTTLDFASARRGQSIYGFWVQCLVGNFRGAVRLERARLAEAGNRPWMSELSIWYGFSLLWLTAALALWGWMGAVFFLGQSLIAIMKLDCINYLQHYGLSRQPGADGKVEAVQAHHAWAHDFILDDLILLNLPRHSEHHMHPRRSYHLLRWAGQAPQYPYNYAVMTLLILVPPLFRRVVHPLLDGGVATLPVRRNDLGYQIGLIGFTRMSSQLRQLHCLIDVHPRYALRLVLVIATSLCGLPLRLWETVRFGRQISQVRIDQPPVFIIGHWRSGTTHMHNLMSQDPAFGYLSMYQAMVPNCSLVGRRWLKPLLARIVPAKRPMDNMVWPMDAPQEEEIPLAKIMPYSFYSRFLFPRRSRELFATYVLLEGAPPRVVKELKRTYYRLLQVATLHAGGKRLILKNPVNTARVALLLELFPDAKFIHVYRCPYDVFASTVNLYSELLMMTTLQALRIEDAGDTILAVYEAMMRRFFQERSLIPQDNLVDVRFEDLERDPLGELARIYDTLALPGFGAAEPAFRSYVRSQQTYSKNRLILSPEDRARVEQHWAFAFAELGYPRLGEPEGDGQAVPTRREPRVKSLSA
jgi:hypothetical protein